MPTGDRFDEPSRGFLRCGSVPRVLGPSIGGRELGVGDHLVDVDRVVRWGLLPEPKLTRRSTACAAGVDQLTAVPRYSKHSCVLPIGGDILPRFQDLKAL